MLDSNVRRERWQQQMAMDKKRNRKMNGQTGMNDMKGVCTEKNHMWEKLKAAWKENRRTIPSQVVCYWLVTDTCKLSTVSL
jgi:hypothetical protein